MNSAPLSKNFAHARAKWGGLYFSSSSCQPVQVHTTLRTLVGCVVQRLLARHWFPQGETPPPVCRHANVWVPRNTFLWAWHCKIELLYRTRGFGRAAEIGLQVYSLSLNLRNSRGLFFIFQIVKANLLNTVHVHCSWKDAASVLLFAVPNSQAGWFSAAISDKNVLQSFPGQDEGSYYNSAAYTIQRWWTLAGSHPCRVS